MDAYDDSVSGLSVRSANDLIMHCILWRHVDRLHRRYKSVNYPFKVFLTLALLFKVMPLNAADISANASRDAMRLVECMKAFDAVCANSLTYAKIFEDHGISRDELDKTVGNFYQKLKSDHATYSRFDLSAPWRPFVVGGLNYIFIPYDMVLEVRGQSTLSKAFFIGVSDDSGVSWRFVDGQKTTRENIGQIIPGYGGGALPPRSFEQSAAQ